MDYAQMFQSALKVLLAGLVFGAGLPAIFAIGIRLQSAGEGDIAPDGTVTRPNPVARVGAWIAFGIVAVAIVIGILWITQKSLHHYLGIDIFGAH
ncbi:hypothetical protein [Branchiibius cervicis]|uniref:DUF4190 domain-containing protein n=1 Tax=Branchiibius cervicis TaxID=908252 RepID=A0ABW2ARL9_9MICO